MASEARFRGPAGVSDGLSHGPISAFSPVGEKKCAFCEKNSIFFLHIVKKLYICGVKRDADG